jgi:hypothetical protein
MPNHSEMDVRDAIIDFQSDIERYNRFCSELERRYPGEGAALLELICLRLLEGKLKWNTRYSIETQIKIFVDDFKVHDAIEQLCCDNKRYNKLCRRLEKQHGWVKDVLDQSWEGYLDLAIERLLEARRNWNIRRYRRIEDQILAIVDSLVSHDYAAAKERAKSIAPLEEADAIAVEQQPYIDSNPKLRQRIFDRIRNVKPPVKQKKLQQLLQFRLDNEPRFNPHNGGYLWSPREIAKRLGWNVTEVYQLTALLRIRLEGLQGYATP